MVPIFFDGKFDSSVCPKQMRMQRTQVLPWHGPINFRRDVGNVCNVNEFCEVCGTFGEVLSFQFIEQLFFF